MNLNITITIFCSSKKVNELFIMINMIISQGLIIILRLIRDKLVFYIF